MTNCHGLKMKAADGKRRMTDVAKTGGQIAGEARQRIEKETGNSVITSQNASSLNSVVTGMIESVIKSDDKDMYVVAYEGELEQELIMKKFGKSEAVEFFGAKDN